MQDIERFLYYILVRTSGLHGYHPEMVDLDDLCKEGWRQDLVDGA